MQYEGQICRAPMERASFMLPVMVGCSYNGCKFCNLFRHLKYRTLPLEQIEHELKRVKACNGNPKRIFLGDGNAFDLPMERLVTILEMIRSYFPSCEMVNMDATVTGILKKKRIFLGDGNAFDLPMERLVTILEMIRSYFPSCEMVNMDATVTGILKKSEEELQKLYELGVRHLYLGIETGLNDVLVFMNKDHTLPEAYEAIEKLHEEELQKLYELGVRHLYLGIETGLNDVLVFMNKDHTLPEAYEAIEKLQKAGLIFDAHIMTGVAGKGRSSENAEELAKFLLETHPAHVVNFSMFMHKEVPLYREVERGNFVQADELECLKEERRLVELLQKGDMPILYDGFHDFIEFRVKGSLPRDGEKMLKKLDDAIQAYEKKEPIYSLVFGECNWMMPSKHMRKRNQSIVWYLENVRIYSGVKIRQMFGI